MKANYALVALVCLFMPYLYAQEKQFTPSGKFSGLMYGEYFYNVEQRDPARQDVNGFQFRRIYFTYDHGISEDFSTRFRLEADQVAFSSNGKIGVFVKDAYLRWKNIFDGSDLFFGISPTPAFEISEAAWGYRSLEKTIIDLRGIVASRDIGVDLRGNLDAEGNILYWVKVGNNSGNSPETDKFKRYYGNLRFQIAPSVHATVYADYDTRAKRVDAADGGILKSNNRATVAGFLNIAESNSYSLGAEAVVQFLQNNYRPAVGMPYEDQQLFGFSLFGWYSLVPNIRIVGRFDSFDPNTDANDDALSLFIFSFDYMPTGNVHVMPNIHIQTYELTGDNDITGRVTFGYTF